MLDYIFMQCPVTGCIHRYTATMSSRQLQQPNHKHRGSSVLEGLGSAAAAAVAADSTTWCRLCAVSMKRYFCLISQATPLTLIFSAR